MKRVYYSLVILLSVLFSTITSATDITVNFASVNINEAKKKAGAEGKLLFIDFHAAWCSPCKWMDQTTFVDASVSKMLNEDFVAVKVDIDEISGFELKNLYDVKYLPTMLIFNSQGQLLDRVEETLTPRKLVALLSKHNAPENKVIFRHEFNTSPTMTDKATVVAESESMKQSGAEYTKYFYQPQTQSAYRVQVGVFERYQGASDMVNTLKQFFTEPITVINEYKDNKAVFKVRIGQFTSIAEAENFKNTLMAEYKMAGIVQ